MKPFARINLSSVLSSVALAEEEALAKGDALRRGSGKCCQPPSPRLRRSGCGSVANVNSNFQ